MFAHMRASEHAESIYYADLFRINGKVWALTGTGKSAAGMAVTGGKREDDLARDSVGFVRDGALLRGRYDPGALNPEMLDDLHALYPLAAVVYCLSEDETTKMFAHRPLGLLDVDPGMVAILLSKSIYPAPLAQHFFDDNELDYLCDNGRRYQHWLKLTNGTSGTRWLVAPWMPSAAEKAALYASLRF
jgi:hypothetical protein